MFKFCISRTNTQFYAFCIQKTKKKKPHKRKEKECYDVWAFVLMPIFNLDFKL